MGPGRFFFYGTLRDADVRAAVIGDRAAARLRVVPARIRGFCAVYAAGKRYPVLRPAHGAIAPGTLVTGVDARAFNRLRAFESGYVLARLPVETAAGLFDARVFLPKKSLKAGTRPFELPVWERRHKPDYLKKRARVG